MKIMILDGNSLINRSFYGIRLLSNKDGVYTNAVYGFLTTYFKLFNEEAPEGVCVCFDLKAPTFRHKEFDVYKAGRRPMPEELVSQVPLTKELLDLLGVPRFELSGYEADDLIGTIARIGEAAGHECVIVTGDRDALQLISDRVRVRLITTKGGQSLSTNYTVEQFAEDYCGLPPRAMIDLKSLSGDKSDNIPGVAGIGDKTAMDLLCRFRSMEGVYENIDSPDIRESVRKKLVADEENARLSYHLATIDRQAPMTFTPDLAVLRPRQDAALFQRLKELDLRSLIAKLSLSPSGSSVPSAPGGKGEDDPFAPPRLAIESEQGLQDALAAAKGAPAAAAAFSPDLTRLALSVGPLCYTFERSAFPEKAWRDFLARLFGEAPTALHDGKNTLRGLLKEGIFVPSLHFDTAVAAYLLSPQAAHYALDGLCLQYLDRPLTPEREEKEGENLSLFEEPAETDPFASLCRQAAAVSALIRVFEPKLKTDGLYGLMRDVELPLQAVLARMEEVGILIDREQLVAFGRQLDERTEKLTGEIYDLAGQAFNINSTKVLGGILFETLGLPHVKKTKTGYSTDIDVLNKLRPHHPIIEKIIDYRQLTKLKSTYVDGLLKVIGGDQRIHTTFQQLVTATGRLSSTDPNLQNIPIRRALGSELRRMFVAQEGCLLVDADYSQIELRVLAHIAGDHAMLDAFCHGGDIHAVTASQVFHVPLSEVTPKMRSAAKAVNFGIVYGISDFSLSEDIGVTRAEAKQYIESYLDHYPGVREYMREIKERAAADGYVTTLFGRRRYLPELQSKNYNVRSFGERVALNTPIQGTAADIIKIAMIRVDRRLRAEGMATRLLLQVHDELILEAPEDEAEKAAVLLKEEMEGAFPMKAPLTADVSMGKSWFDAK